MATMPVERRRSVWLFWAGWVAANVLGWVVGLYLAVGLGWGITAGLAGATGELGAMLVGWLVAGLVGGGVIGLLQAAVLKERGVAFGRWILATALGLGLGLATAFPLLLGLFPGDGPDPRSALILSIAGLILAAAQWLVLRRAVARAWLWLPAGALALALFFLVGLLLGGQGREVIAFSAGGLVYAAITGAALALILRRAQTGL